MPSSGGSAEAHSRLVNETLLEIGATKYCRVWKNATGSARSMDGDRIISFGLPGSADILGILRNGRFLAIEIKTGKAKQSKKQRDFQRMVEKFNGFYIVVRPEDLDKILVRIIKESKI